MGATSYEKAGFTFGTDWNHIICVFTNMLFTCRVNDTETAKGGWTAAITNPTEMTYATRTCAISGNQASTVANRFNGNVSTVNFWSVELSTASMTAQYTARSPKPAATPSSNTPSSSTGSVILSIGLSLMMLLVLL